MSEGFLNLSLPSNIWEMTYADLVYVNFKRLEIGENTQKATPPEKIDLLMNMQLHLRLPTKPQNILPKPWDGFNNNFHRFNNGSSASSQSSYSSRTRTFSGSSTSSKPLLNICTYCRNINLPYIGHTKDECFALASLHPCRICFASGTDNHTATYCPFKPKILLKLKPEYVFRYFTRRRAGSLPMM